MGKNNLWATGNHLDLLDTYLLFGDPATRIQTQPLELEAPTNLAATAISISEISLSWTDNASNETAYLIERSPDGSSSWIEIDSVDTDVTTYSNTGLNPDETWFYSVRAYRADDDQYSAYSNTDSATTIALPAAPTDLVATAVSSNQIDLSWSDNADDETDYRVERAISDSGPWIQIKVLGANITTCSDSSLDPDTTYYYRVRAYRAQDELFSDYSNVDNAKTDVVFQVFLPLILH